MKKDSYIDCQEGKEEQSEDLLLEQNCNEESIHEMATGIEVGLASAFYF